jgi:hypothetical protein
VLRQSRRLKFSISTASRTFLLFAHADEAILWRLPSPALCSGGDQPNEWSCLRWQPLETTEGQYRETANQKDHLKFLNSFISQITGE